VIHGETGRLQPVGGDRRDRRRLHKPGQRAAAKRLGRRRMLGLGVDVHTGESFRQFEPSRHRVNAFPHRRGPVAGEGRVQVDPAGEARARLAAHRRECHALVTFLKHLEQAAGGSVVLHGGQ